MHLAATTPAPFPTPVSACARLRELHLAVARFAREGGALGARLGPVASLHRAQALRLSPPGVIAASESALAHYLDDLLEAGDAEGAAESLAFALQAGITELSLDLQASPLDDEDRDRVEAALPLLEDAFVRLERCGFDA